MDLRTYNTRWLQAWSDKDVDALLSFYAPTALYRDAESPDGIEGHDELRQYFSQIFAATPPARYETENLWPVEGGYVVRWLGTIEGPEEFPRQVRGIGIVMLDGERIVLNEMYTHTLLSVPVPA